MLCIVVFVVCGLCIVVVLLLYYMVCAECVLYCAIFTSKRIQKHETCDQSHAKTREIKTRQDKTRQDETRQDQTDIYGHLRIINY